MSSKGGSSVNAFIDKDMYLGEHVNLKYPNIDALVDLIKAKGPGCLIFKRDLSRDYRQIFIDPREINLVGYVWNSHLFLRECYQWG